MTDSTTENEHLYSPWHGGCQGRDDPHGGTQRCQERIGKDHWGEACDSEDIPGGVTIKNEKGALRMQGVFWIIKVLEGLPILLRVFREGLAKKIA